MDNVSVLNENNLQSRPLRLHETVRRREPSRPEAALSPDELFSRFRAADPTRNAAFLSWLLRTYAAGGCGLEDLPKARETFKTFARLRGILPDSASIDGEIRNPRKLGSHMSLESLWSAVALLVENEKLVKESDSNDESDRERALSQSRVLHRSERMVLAVPLTEEASCWWGRGTQWCTSGRKDNVFDKYYRIAPLIVVCLKRASELPARKLQLHVHPHDMQFRDDNNAPVSRSIIQERWQDLSGLLHWAVTQYGRAIQLVPEHLRTEALCLGAVTQNGQVLRLVPAHLLTKAVCLAAVTNDGDSIRFMPENLRTEDICLAAVTQYGWALQFMPVHLRTEEVCLAAVTRYGQALQLVPAHLRTEAVCLAAVTQNGRTLESVPEHMRTEEVCTIAALQNMQSLVFLPQKIAAITSHNSILNNLEYSIR